MNSITFASIDCATLEGHPVYRAKEYSFDFIPTSKSDLSRLAGSSGTTSILIGTLQVEIGVETKMALFVWGYHTVSELWRPAQLPNISTRRTGLRFSSLEELISGVSLRLASDNQWQTIYDATTGWIRVGSDLRFVNAEYVEFANQTVAELYGGDLIAIWLRPEWV